MAIIDATNIDAQGSDSTMIVEDLPTMASMATIDTLDGQISDVINLNGEDDGDTFVIDATVDTNYVINVNDTGTDYQDGQNDLIINGAVTTEGQVFLLRTDFVAIVETNGGSGNADAPDNVYERINYNNIANVLGIDALEINGGNVTNTAFGNFFYLDGNSAVTTINAGNGADWFQVGQVYSLERLQRPDRR